LFVAIFHSFFGAPCVLLGLLPFNSGNPWLLPIIFFCFFRSLIATLELCQEFVGR